MKVLMKHLLKELVFTKKSVDVQRHAYVDETGNNGMDFDKPNVSSHYIIVAIIVDSAKRQDIENQTKAIQTEFFQSSAIKSSKVKSNVERRIRVLSALSELSFGVLAVVVDKRELKGPGYQYMGSFYKSLHSRLYTLLVRSFKHLKIVTDRYGDNEFMAGFRKYVLETQPGDLFDNRDVEFVDSEGSPLVQVADFVAGSLARHYDTLFHEPRSGEILQVLKPRFLMIDEWPPSHQQLVQLLDEQGGQFDAIIAQSACRAALHFIELKEKHHDPLVREQVACMRVLLLHFQISPRSYVSARKIIRQLSHLRDSPMNLKYFQMRVIAKLRDQDMLIASSGKGYKLPTSIGDCTSWLDRGLRTMEPLLGRIRRYRDVLKLASEGELDILEDTKYRTIRDFADRQTSLQL